MTELERQAAHYRDVRARLYGLPTMRPAVRIPPPVPRPPPPPTEAQERRALYARMYEALNYAREHGNKLPFDDPATEAEFERASEVLKKSACGAMKWIVREIAARDKIPAEMILSRVRIDMLVDARHEAIWRVKQACPGLNWNNLARMFAMDHSSVMHAVKRWGPIQRRRWRL